VVRVLVEPGTVWLECWLNLGLGGWSAGCTWDCVVGVLVEPGTVWLECWLNLGLCGWSAG